MTSNSTAQPSRAERRRHETRSKLLDATRSLIHEVGYANLNVRAITERADLGYGTFYVYFADKDEIVWEAAVPNMQQVVVEVNTNAATLPASQRELYAWYVTFYRAELKRDLMLSIFGRNGSPALLARYHDFLTQIIRTGVDGLYRLPPDVPLDVVAQFTAAAVIRLTIWWLLLYSEAAPEMPELAE